MLLVKAVTRESEIAGKGLFVEEAVRKGTVVSLHAADATVLTEQEYQHEQRIGNELVIRTGIRWVGPYFLYAQEERPEAFINHSTDPSLLYHCGISFARRDLKPGDELTVDYSLFLAEDDVEGFHDSAEETQVTGLPPRDALISSTEQLLRLLREITEIR